MSHSAIAIPLHLAGDEQFNLIVVQSFACWKRQTLEMETLYQNEASQEYSLLEAPYLPFTSTHQSDGQTISRCTRSHLKSVSGGVIPYLIESPRSTPTSSIASRMTAYPWSLAQGASPYRGKCVCQCTCGSSRANQIQAPPNAVESSASVVSSWRLLHLSRAKLKGSASTSELLAGFATVAMVEVNINKSTAVPEWLFVLFTATTSIVVSVHIFALMISTYVLPNIDAIFRIHPKGFIMGAPHESMRRFVDVAWTFSTLLGLFLFLFDVAVICWIQLLDFSYGAALAGSIIVGPVLFAFMALVLHFHKHLVICYLDDDDSYSMGRACRGKAIIFNNDEFEDGEPESRPGSAKDVETLEETFKCLGLREDDIVVKKNFNFHQIIECLKELSEADYTDVDCLIITVLSHGSHDGWIYAYDTLYKDQKLWNAFTAENCKSLAEKPKIFFVQACRGNDRDVGIDVKTVGNRGVGGGGVGRSSVADAVSVGGQRDSSTDQADAAPTSYTIPTHADFLIAHSSSKDMVSWRDPEKGTWFIQSLCQELQASDCGVDLLDIMTRTARRVACDHEGIDVAGRWKQVPSITSTLTRNLFFFPQEL